MGVIKWQGNVAVLMAAFLLLSGCSAGSGKGNSPQGVMIGPGSYEEANGSRILGTISSVDEANGTFTVALDGLYAEAAQTDSLTFAIPTHERQGKKVIEEGNSVSVQYRTFGFEQPYPVIVVEYYDVQRTEEILQQLEEDPVVFSPPVFE